MGGCASTNSGDGGVAVVRETNPKPRNSAKKAFQGTGNRLGSANEPSTAATAGVGGAPRNGDRRGGADNDPVPPPRVDPALTEDERAKQREERLRAAEVRQKKQTISAKPNTKKNASGTAAALRGPHPELLPMNNNWD